MYRIYAFLAGLVFYSAAVHSEELMVQSLSEGACWYEQVGDVLKLSSFNDKEVLFITRFEVEELAEGLLHLKKGANKGILGDLNLHCGGYGSSLVMKYEYEGRQSCLWLRPNKGKLELRSFGGLESSKNDLCDGYKWGELIVGLRDLEQISLLESEQFRPIIKSVKVISGLTVKITLGPEYHGLELKVRDDLRQKIDLKYIELNLFQHPVGEAVAIK